MALKCKDPWGDDRSTDEARLQASSAGALADFVRREAASSDTSYDVDYAAIAEAARKAGYAGATAAICRMCKAQV